MEFFAKLLRGAACLATALGLALPAPAQTLPPLADFFDRPAVADITLSPDGSQVGMIVHPRGQRARLVVMDTEKMTAKVVASFADGDVTAFNWINDKRVVFTVRRLTFAFSVRMAVDSDGTGMSEPLGPGGFFAAPLQDSDDFFVESVKYDNKGNYQRTDLRRINSRTGKITILQAPGDTSSWLLDDKGEPSVVTVREGGTPPRTSAQYRDPATKEWRKLFEYDAYGTAAIIPHSLGPAGSSVLYVRAYNGRDKSALHAYDLTKNQLDPQPVVSLANYDFDGRLIRHAGRVVGVRYVGDALAHEWLDASFKEIQAKVDKLLPATMNLVLSAVRNQSSKLLVVAYSDRDPSITYLYDTGTGKLAQLGKWRPGIDPKQMARVEVVKYPGQDGMEIPARLTLPQGQSRNLPLVVLVHSGPWSRGGSWGWEGGAQFLASRGYAVLQPEFRGSRGFGQRHFEAGMRQWGLAMQDDLAAGARWAAQQGYADSKRVCISGYAYGGYAALMGLARHPDIYRCGIALQPITDLEEYASNWQYFGEEARMHGIPLLLGDVEKDAAQLKATSPLNRAADIRQPVLLAHWDGLRQIPFFHGSKMRDALKASGVPVEWVGYSNPWTPDRDAEETKDAWSRIEKFLARNLAQP